uniref:Uncharacterized protein n=1 Tax=Tetraselmis sp. GSL018 TaxID=582737 RepID=A0A061S4D6_9CHLO
MANGARSGSFTVRIGSHICNLLEWPVMLRQLCLVPKTWNGLPQTFSHDISPFFQHGFKRHIYLSGFGIQRVEWLLWGKSTKWLLWGKPPFVGQPSSESEGDGRNVTGPTAAAPRRGVVEADHRRVAVDLVAEAPPCEFARAADDGAGGEVCEVGKVGEGALLERGEAPIRPEAA